ncbi:HCLS1-binding protein 3 isoform X2 [Scyliorhinus torazame]|uniref:HCLS1-binding protein 3 isoform X2 n=1 Tax=Scyliorhinus torazame TaxID=75743 RepID=UPI003B5AEE06
MPEGLITSRTIQNVHTGIDLSVPEYQEIHGKLMTGHVEYQIVVVTQLASFKSAKHKAKDVVQFVVSKKYSEIDDLCQKLSTQYPKTNLPSMPRKVLFVGETDIKERRIVFDEIFRFIAKNATLASSPELMDFLGAKTKDLGDLKFKTRNAEDEELQEDEGEPGDFFNQETFKDSGMLRPSKPLAPTVEKSVEISDPLGIMSYKLKNTESSNQETKQKLTLFDEEVDDDADLFEPVKSFTQPAIKKSPFKDRTQRAPRCPIPRYMCQRASGPTPGPTRWSLSPRGHPVLSLHKGPQPTLLHCGSQGGHQRRPCLRGVQTALLPARPGAPGEGLLSL